MVENCQYCGTARSGDPTVVACPFCGQVVPKKPMHRGPRKHPTTPQAALAKAQQIAAALGLTAVTRRAMPAKPPVQYTPSTTATRSITAVAAKRPAHRTAEPKKPHIIWRLINFLFITFCLLSWLGLLLDVLKTIKNPEADFHLDKAPLFAVFGWLYHIMPRRGMLRSFLGFLIVSTSAMILIMIPFIAPRTRTWNTSDGEVMSSRFSWDSETHLYFLMPGLILALTAVVSALRGLGRLVSKGSSRS